LDIVRQPAVAGRFYPADPAVLHRDLNSYLLPSTAARRVLACMVPHAGYMYSGTVAGSVFASIQVPECCLVLCPNHTGRGHPLAIMSTGGWLTPFGSVPIDSELAESLKKEFPLLGENSEAHRTEHAIEVELPFLQRRQPHLRFVPIALGTSDFNILEVLGHAVAAALKRQAAPVLIVASSDMNHYENDAVTRAKDHNAIGRILELDPRGLYDVVVKEDISMCGFGAAVVMLTAAKDLGASQAELIRYATSGDVSGDHDTVVGYAGIVAW
jgi:MEMO1 family protein